jgi:hypothetical protein
VRSGPCGAVAMTSAEAAHDARKSAGSAGRTVGPAGRTARRASSGRAVDLNMAVAVRKAAAADTAADAGRAADPANGSARAGRTDSMAAARPRCPPLHGSGCRALPLQGRTKDIRSVLRVRLSRRVSDSTGAVVVGVNEHWRTEGCGP